MDHGGQCRATCSIRRSPFDMVMNVILDTHVLDGRLPIDTAGFYECG